MTNRYKKLPKTMRTYHKRLEEARAAGRMQGKIEAREELEKELATSRAKLADREKTIHLNALEALTKLGSTHGQLMATISRALQSEKGQL